MRPARLSLSIVAGGQSGVDRAALDAALALGIPAGGWCPKGRWAEDGPISDRYPLRETDSAEPDVRTEANVRDSDATLVVVNSVADKGTRRTIECARRAGKPCLIVDLADDAAASAAARAWLTAIRPRTLNVAGPRESRTPGIYARATAFLEDLLRNVAVDDDLHQRTGL